MSHKNTSSPEAGSSFAPVFKVLSESRRNALSAYYHYARVIDDIADNTYKSVDDKKISLEYWRRRIDAIFAGSKTESDLENELAQTSLFYNLKKEHFTLLLDGVTMDLTNKEYATIEELEYYMYRVAVVVGQVCLKIFGYEGKNADLIAEKMGYAVQLTNILRDVKEDYYNGRIYIPYQDLARFNVDPKEFGSSDYSKEFIELMSFEVSRAKAYYCDTLPLVEKEYKKKFIPSLIIWNLYYELLLKIEKNGYKVKEGRTRLTGAQKIITIVKIIFRYMRL